MELQKKVSRIVKDYPDHVAILLIIVTAILVHGVAIPRLGYYHDDWYMLWSGAFRGNASLISLFNTDRPFMGLIYSVFYRVITDHIWGWHVLALFFRIFGACAFYWILTLVWPRKDKKLYALSGMLFVIFPGFLAQPNAATKVMQLMSFSSALFSIGLTVNALRKTSKTSKVINTVFSLLFMAYYLLLYEYMIGFEFMRFILIYLVTRKSDAGKIKQTLQKTLQLYIPNIIVLGMFLFWRVFIFDSSRGPTNMGGLVRTYFTDPGYMSLRLFFQTVRDFLTASVFAWFEMAYTYIYNASFSGLAAAFMITAIVLLIALYYIKQGKSGIASDNESAFSGEMLLVGMLITLGSVFPVVVSNRMIDLHDVYKAYALHPSAGVIIMLIGLLLAMKSKYRNGAILVLLAVSACTQSLNIDRWATYWDVQQNYWWQVYWRAPEVKPNTLVMAYAPTEYQFQQDYEIWGPMNFLYWDTAQEWPQIQAEILNADTAVELYKQSFLEPHVRDIYLPKYYSHFLLLSQPDMTSCVHIIDGRHPVYSANEKELVKETGEYSNLEMINVDSAQDALPENIFGKEPEHGWCYFYQKAELARQKGDWSEIADIYKEVSEKELTTNDGTEYLVYIEGLINSGNINRARELIQNKIRYQGTDHFAMCNQLGLENPFPESYGYLNEEIYLELCETIDH